MNVGENMVSNPSAKIAKKINAVRVQSMTEIVQQELQRMVLDRVLEPGQHLNENALANSLGVSRGPVREACRGLQSAGLLEMKPNRGFFVVEIDKEEAAEIYEARAGVFAYACQLATQRATTKQIAGLRELVDQMDRSAVAGDVEAYSEINAKFHSGILAASGNNRLARLHLSLFHETNLLRQRAFSRPAGLPKSNAEHGELLSAIEQRDAVVSFERGMQHVLSGKKRHLQGL